MRIALIQTPVEDFYFTPQRSYPLGLTYLAAAIKDLPVEVEIIDLITGYGRQTIAIPDNFRPIKKYLPYDNSPISAFHTYYHFGLSWEKIEDFFQSNQYDLYALSSNFYTYSEEILITGEIIKKSNPNALVLVGGQNVGPEHDLFINSPDIDICVTGEGEYAFRELVIALLENKPFYCINGIWDPSEKQWNKNPCDFDFKIAPDASLLDVDKYKISGEPARMISTSRGCPMGCRFCSVSRTFGKKMRLRPVDEIVLEMKEAFEKGIRSFDIEDDNFTFNRSHCVDLLKTLSEIFNNEVKIYAMNGLSAEHIDKEIIDLLINSGMILLNLSIATGSEEELKKLHRHTSVEYFKQITGYAAGKGLKVMGHFISGLPKQTLEEILSTMKILAELPLVLGISPFYYIPGMDLKVPNKPPTFKEARLSRFWPADKVLDELDLITLFRLSRWINYLKNRLRSKKLNKINFKDISKIFADDPYINNLINDKKIIGVHSNNQIFCHEVSETVIDGFFSIFHKSYVYSE